MTAAHSRSDFQKLLAGYQLVTAHILYRIPDHQDLLQQFIWQEFDLVPKLPALNKFLAFWKQSIDGPLHEVRVACAGLLLPSDVKYYKTHHVITMQ